MRRPPRRQKKVTGQGNTFRAKPMRQRHRQMRAHAVAKKTEGPVVHIGDQRSQRIQKRRERRTRRLAQPVLAPRQLDRDNRDVGRQGLAPAPVYRRPAARVRETEKSRRAIRLEGGMQNPGAQTSLPAPDSVSAKRETPSLKMNCAQARQTARVQRGAKAQLGLSAW